MMIMVMITMTLMMIIRKRRVTVLLGQVDPRRVLVASKAHIQSIDVFFCQLDMVPDVVQLSGGMLVKYILILKAFVSLYIFFNVRN